MSKHPENDEDGTASASNSTAALKSKLFKGETDEQRKAALLEHPSYLELQAKLEAAEEKATQNWERVLRMQADMDNTQRRVERDVANAHKYALEKFVLDLLPIVDSMERGLQISSDEQSVNAVLEGIQMTLTMFYSTLEKFGVLPVDPQGEAFNPELHQAVSIQPSGDAKSGTVLNVLQKGYLLNNRLIRPAMVVVAKD